MKILQVNSVYRKGSTGKIVYDVHCELQRQGVESVVCYGRGTKIQERGVYKFCSEVEAHASHLWVNWGGLQYAGAPIATAKLKHIIEKERPNVVHLHCINGYCVNIFSTLRYLARHHIKTVVTHHGEFLYTGNCGHSLLCNKWMNKEGCHHCDSLREATGSRMWDNSHRSWRLMREAFARFAESELHFTAVSPWVMERSRMNNVIRRYPCTFVPNGVDTSVFHYSKEKENRIWEKLPEGRSDFVLHVTAFFSTSEQSLKGGRYIVELAKRMPQQLFVVVASVVQECESLPSNVMLWGRANGQEELAALYSAAQATVIVSERETFSMVTAESLCCGTPVVGFKAGGPESIALPAYSAFVEYANVEVLKQALEAKLSLQIDKAIIAKTAQAHYDRKVMTDGYVEVYKLLCNGKT